MGEQNQEDISKLTPKRKRHKTSADYHEIVGTSNRYVANDNKSTGTDKIKKMIYVLAPLVLFLALVAWF